MKMKISISKRIHSLLLAFFIVLTCIPISLFTTTEVKAASSVKKYLNYGVCVQISDVVHSKCGGKNTSVAKILLKDWGIYPVQNIVTYKLEIDDLRCFDCDKRILYYTKNRTIPYGNCKESLNYTIKQESGEFYWTETYTRDPSWDHSSASITPSTCKTQGKKVLSKCLWCNHHETQMLPLDPNNHEWGSWVSRGDGTHERTCTNNCAGAVEVANCSGGTPNCIEQAVCEICKSAYGSINAKKHASTETYFGFIDDNTHGEYYSCCNELKEKKAHNEYRAASCQEVAYCDVCESDYGTKNPDNHVVSDTYYQVIDNDTHGIYHTCCNALFSTETHTADSVSTCTNQEHCSKCLSTYGEKNENNHTGELVWSIDNYRHIKQWNCCNATEGVLEMHIPVYAVNNDGTVLSATCETCGTDLGSATIRFDYDGNVYDGKIHKAEQEGVIYNTYGEIRITYWQNDKQLNTVKNGGIIQSGTYVVRMGPLDNPDIYIEKEVTINKRELTVAGVYAYNKDYDGTNIVQAYSASFNNVVEGERIFCGIKGTVVVNGTDVGSYETVTGIEKINLFTLDIESYHGDNYYVKVDSSQEYPIIEGCNINPYTLYITANNQSVTAGNSIVQNAYTIENLLEGYVCTGIVLETNVDNNVIRVNTNEAVITYNDKDITKNFDFNTYTGILQTVCVNHKFDQDGFCATRKCDIYQTPEYTIDEFGNKTYVITNAGELYFFAQQANVYGLGYDGAILDSDIFVPLTEGQGGDIPDWTPINELYATFDGQGHTISGLYCKDNEASYVGMFGYTGYYPIKNLIITNSYFEGSGKVGAVAGYSQAEISNCGVTNMVTVINSGDEVGCFVGNNTNSIVNSYTMNSSFVNYNAEGYGAVLENCYYISEEVDSFDGTTAMTNEAFVSGEVAYLLQENIVGDSTTAEEIWGQNIGLEPYPVLGGAKVYVFDIYDCPNDTEAVSGYSNNVDKVVRAESHPDDDEDCACDVCGRIEHTDVNHDGKCEGCKGTLAYIISSTFRVLGTSGVVADIVMNPSDGYVNVGEEVTVTAPQLSDYTFNGWYVLSDIDEKNQIIEGKKALSTEYVYTFVPKTDVSLVAVYTQKKIDVEKIPLSDVDVVLPVSGFVYTGEAITPTVKVTYNDKELAVGKDYTVSFANNVSSGTATATVTGMGNYTGTVTKEFTIKKVQIDKAKVTLSKTSYTYNGKAQKPEVTVVVNGKKLTANTDYTVAYKNNKNIGTATATVTGKGNYTGALTKKFTIKVKKGATFTVNKNQYTVTNDASVKFTKTTSTGKTLEIPKVVKYGGKEFKVTAVASKALKGNKKITKVTIGANVTSIESSAFAGCTKLATVTIGNKVKTIGVSAFEGCKKLSKVTLGSAVTTINAKAFKNCTALKSIIIPSKVTTYGKQAFYGCKNLKTITFKSKTIKSAGKEAFKNINAKATIKVPKNSYKKYVEMLKAAGAGNKIKIVKTK